MIPKRIVTEFRELHRVKNRAEKGLFIAEGEKVVDELLNSSLKIRTMVARPEFLEKHDLKLPSESVFSVSEKELEQVSLLTTPNQVAVIAEIPVAKPLDFNNSPSVMLCLDAIKDPGNLGTIIRTADWFGINEIVCSPDCVDFYNPKVVQSAMGSLFRTMLRYESLESLLPDAGKHGYHIMGAVIDGESIQSIPATSRLLLVIGNESHGIDTRLIPYFNSRVTISKNQHSKAESLNAAVACGILLSSIQTILKK